MRIRSAILGLVLIIAGAAIGAVSYRYWVSQNSPVPVAMEQPDKLFGWKIPVNSIAFAPTGRNLFDFQIAYSDIRDPGGIPQGLPVRLKVPVIGVDTAIEDAFITPDGRMDVPQGSVNVAWFALGPKPGQEGSAVIGGHYGLRNGVSFVFYNLDKVKIGDKVYIVDDRSITHAFIVRNIKLFARDADATPVFVSNDGLSHLNLITCEGVWNKVNDTYPLRRVVFTDEVPFEGSIDETATIVPTVAPTALPTISATPTPTSADYRALSFGATGTDVAELQLALEKKGFLTMPAGIARGTYGATTRNAVSAFQTSVNLPSTGIYDDTTRAMLTAEPTLPLTALPTPSPTQTPVLTLTPPPSENPQPSSSPLEEAVGSLFATTPDRIITAVLIIAIVFMIFTIIRRSRRRR